MKFDHLRIAFQGHSRSSEPTPINPSSLVWYGIVEFNVPLDTVYAVISDFLLTFHSKHGPISYRFQSHGPFGGTQPKRIQIFGTPTCINMVWPSHHIRHSNSNMPGRKQRVIKGFITSSTVTLHCGKAHVQRQWKRANYDPMTSKSPKIFKFELTSMSKIDNRH